MKLISFSLWGIDSKYVVGAIRNAELAPAIYPGWRCRFYCAASVPTEAIARLASFPHVEVVRREDPREWNGQLWRMEAAGDPDIEALIVRDTDSRLNVRERAAVDAWLATGASAHAMRDHPWHNVPMLAGMWGIRGGVLPDVRDLLVPYYLESQQPAWCDQRFLADVVVPRVKDSLVEHDEYFAGCPYPTGRRWREYVGQPFDEHERPLIKGPTAIERRLRATVRAIRRQVLGR